jgi:hypothetical protein
VIAAGTAVAGPVLLVATAGLGLPYVGATQDPDLPTLVHDPGGFVVLLLLTGAYPVVAYVVYLCAGLAVGRLDLRSRSVALRLLEAGLALAVTSRLVAWARGYPLGGLAQLTGRWNHHPARPAVPWRVAAVDRRPTGCPPLTRTRQLTS